MSVLVGLRFCLYTYLPVKSHILMCAGFLICNNAAQFQWSVWCLEGLLIEHRWSLAGCIMTLNNTRNSVYSLCSSNQLEYPQHRFEFISLANMLTLLASYWQRVTFWICFKSTVLPFASLKYCHLDLMKFVNAVQLLSVVLFCHFIFTVCDCRTSLFGVNRLYWIRKRTFGGIF